MGSSDPPSPSPPEVQPFLGTDNDEYRRALGSEALRQEVVARIGPRELQAFALISPEMILAARQLHAQAYLKSGHVTPLGIDPETNTLIEAIDSSEVVRDSRYIGTLNPDRILTGCIRLIAKDDIRELPTMAKLIATYGADNPLFAQLPPRLMNGAPVFEGSALGRIPEGDLKDLTGMSRLFIAIVLDAAARGFEYGVVGFVGNTAERLKKIYGQEAFQRIGSELEVVTLQGKGLRRRPDGLEAVTLKPHYIEVNNFMRQCLNHLEERPNRFFTRVNRPLFEAGIRFIMEQT